MKLSEAVLAEDRASLARLITLIENDAPEGGIALNELFPHTGHAHLVGVTGAPGTGKSTLVSQLARTIRQAKNGGEPKKVAILAVDPSSPFSGGAVLGDRVRMRDLSGDEGVFIRSMAARGSLGGLARMTAAVVQALDAAGFDLILIETVGAGQNEVEIAGLAHTVVVVENPGQGDEIQAIKAGLLEIADIVVINKADRQGVDAAERALRSALEPGLRGGSIFSEPGHPGPDKSGRSPVETEKWVVPILRCVASKGRGVEELLQAVRGHKEFLVTSGEWEAREKTFLKADLDGQLTNSLMKAWRKSLAGKAYDEMLVKVLNRRISPSQAAGKLIELN